MMRKPTILIPTLFAVALAGCASNAGPKENTGTAGGAIAGALIGSTIGGGTGERVGAALAGAAIGGLIGNRIGASLDEQDRRLAYEAQMRALDQGPAGTPVQWRNPQTGRYGDVVPGAAYQRQGMRCRPFTQVIYIDGQPQTERGTACRNPDGTWSALS